MKDEWDDPFLTDVELTADERVRQVVLEEARTHSYLHTCEDSRVVEALGSDGYYGCETGCRQLHIEVTLTCPHFERLEWTYDGELAGENLTEFMERMARVG